MWHTVAYVKSTTNGQTNVNLPGLAENALIIGTQNGFRLIDPMYLAAAWSLPNNGTGFRMTSPKFAQFSPIEVLPVGPGPKETNGLLVSQWPFRAPIFRPQEEVTASVDTGGTAAAIETLLASLQTTVDAPAGGEELTVKYTSTVAAVANTWTLLGAPTLAIVLPEGAYQLVSSVLQSTNAQAHRYIFSGQFYRPGYPSTTAFTNQQWPGIYDYRLGVAGVFSNITLPQIEALVNGTDASHTGFMKVIKVQ